MTPHYAYSPSCTKDYVQIYVGLDITSSNTLRICGSGINWTVNVSINEAFLHYHTDGYNTVLNTRGFEAQFVTYGK